FIQKRERRLVVDALHKKRKSLTRQCEDGSSPRYKACSRNAANPANGSLWFVQVRPVYWKRYLSNIGWGCLIDSRSSTALAGHRSRCTPLPYDELARSSISLLSLRSSNYTHHNTRS